MRHLAVATLLFSLTGPVLAQEQPQYMDDRSTPEGVIGSFYNAINRHEYARAWSYFQEGDGVTPFAEFVTGYDETAFVAVSFGQSAQEGAAGSTYWTLPVSLDATGTDGEHNYYAGCYTLRLVSPANQAEPPFRPLHIVEGKLKTAPGAGQGFAPANCGP